VKPNAIHLQEATGRWIVTFRFLREMAIDHSDGGQCPDPDR
jgi:hypothetical protein